VQVLGAGEAGEEVGEVRRGKVVVEREISEARANGPIEEALDFQGAVLDSVLGSMIANLLESPA
jgi:hypothetical protein